MISSAKAGIFAGAIIAVVWVAFGFWACVLVAAGMLAGGLIGRIVDGKLDLRGVTDALRGRRSSS